MVLRRFQVGAEFVKGEVSFRVWAPKYERVDIMLVHGKSIPMSKEKDGYFSALAELPSETLYSFRLGDKKVTYPDPASRFQPEGPLGHSQIIDPFHFRWSDQEWEGLKPENQILYELHIGTFTKQGTWCSAMEKLAYLSDLGITVIEMMPVGEFPGKFNWGYDGVNLFAPTHNYGTPDDLRAFINEAHRVGIGVILDVVYNHFGPHGNSLNEFSPYYFTDKHTTEWGKAINFDGPESEKVRHFFIANAGYWIEEFHFDGLRFDACQAIKDDSSPHILSEITSEVKQRGGSYVIAENEAQEINLVKEYGLDAIWNEDFHHTSRVKITGHNDGYFNDYLGHAQEFVSSAKHGFLFQGQWYRWQKKRRGSSALKVKPFHFINFLQNHDQVANSPGSHRAPHFCSPALYRALTAYFLLMPQTPLLFHGQEFGATTPFFYFSDQPEELAEKVFKGRLEFLSQFDDLKVKEIPVPHHKETFIKSKLQWEEKEKNPALYHLHRDLIEMRKNDVVFNNFAEVRVEGAVFTDNAFLIRYFFLNEERLLVVNLDKDLFVDPAPEPLLAPPNGESIWELIWSSEESRYGGNGTRDIPARGNWFLTGPCTFLFHPKKGRQ